MLDKEGAMKIRHIAVSAAALLTLSLSSLGNAQTFTFQQGVAGYSGTVTVLVNAGQADTSYVSSDLSEDRLSVDAQNEEFSDTETQVLIRFDDILAGGAIPAGTSIVSATLRLYTVSSSSGPV
ncbi:MAG: hypothetical protein RIC89_20850, partial [Pseudomonadales bacterium]